MRAENNFSNGIPFLSKDLLLEYHFDTLFAI